jgi:hypothetical protein
VNGTSYAARVLRQNVFEMQLASEAGVDAIPRITIELANADSHFSELERSSGFKGAQITVSLVFYNFASAASSSSQQVLFKGLLNPPELITEERFRISAINRLSLQRVQLPAMRVQKRCPWNFPATSTERQEAVSGGASGPYSRFFGCGYSADQTGGCGNLAPDGTAFTTCSFTRTDCAVRGMFNIDTSNQTTARFGGIEYVPPTINVRSAGEKGSHLSAALLNEARYNDFVPLIYGTAWFNPSVVFARNDGNLTRFEVLLGSGEIQGVQKVLVNQIEIPVGQSGANMTGTGWYNLVSAGTRNGAFNGDFADSEGNPLGDPYGSMAYLSVVVPNRINDGSTLPEIRVLIDGLKIPVYAADGTSLGTSFSNNPTWIILDLLRRIGWADDEIDLASFAATAAYCAEAIQTKDLFGNSVQTPRFQCNLVIKGRRTAADIIRGIRNSSRLLLRYGANGLLQLLVENAIALQQPNPIASSNAEYTLDGGWAAYEFGDGTDGTGGIARMASDASSVQITSRSTSDTPNRFACEFQDAFNDYQQDSLSFVDADDVAKAGQEVTGTAAVLGLPHYDQAARILQFLTQKSTGGNLLIEFETSIKALGLAPGDIIAVSYLKEGLSRAPFRVVRIQPGPNFRTARIVAQQHNDSWYYDTNGQTDADAARRQGLAGIGLPRPLSGVIPDDEGELQFAIAESAVESLDGTTQITATVAFGAPLASTNKGPDIPLVSLIPTISFGSGTLATNQTLYYALSCVSGDGDESALSFVVPATIPESTAQVAITLVGLSFPPSATVFNVYRGPNPSALNLIAEKQPLATTFTDSGLAATSILPPDPNYDHSNFYWRQELQPPVNATTFDAITVGASILEMPPDKYAGMTVRIMHGKGAGQERAIVSNSATVLTIAVPWHVVPDSSSEFSVAQSTFQFGATTKTSPVEFQIPNQAGNAIHISGRSANCNGLEAPYELSPLTRWVIGGAGIVRVDHDVPAQLSFGLHVPDNQGGTVILDQIGFQDFTNTTTIGAGTYKLYYIDEVAPPTSYTLVNNVQAGDQTIVLAPALSGASPTYFLIDAEIVAVRSVDAAGTTYSIDRAAHSSSAARHDAGATVIPLLERAIVVPFSKGFFGSPAAGDWSYPVLFPNVRIASAELFVTNSQGNSLVGSASYTGLAGGGWRTLSGGQFSFQIPGYLAVQAGAAPDILVDAPKVIRDISAFVKQPPSGGPVVLTVTLNGVAYCTLTIPDGATEPTSAIDGSALKPMQYQDRLSIDIISVGTTVPGSDLTVTIRI